MNYIGNFKKLIKCDKKKNQLRIKFDNNEFLNRKSQNLQDNVSK